MEIKSYGFIEKASALGEGEVEVIVNSGQVDSSGERIDVSGIDLKEYKNNPVILWAHDGYNLPIARAKKVWADGKKLKAIAEFYLKDEFPRKVYNYVKDGFLKGVSIGGMVDEWGSDGSTIKRLIMKEFSFVPIGMDAKALVTAKSFTKEQEAEFAKLEKDYLLHLLTKGDLNIIKDLQKRVNTLEQLVATLKELVSDDETKEGSALRVVLRQAQAVDNHTENIIKVIKRNKT